MAKVRPTQAVNETELLGKNVLLFLNYGENATALTPKWTLIGGQRDASISVTADEIDASDKTTGGYGKTLAGNKSVELSLEIVIKTGDEVIGELYKAFEAGEAVQVLRWVKNGRSSTNWYTISSIEESASQDDVSLLSATLKGKGAPVYTENMADPRG